MTSFADIARGAGRSATTNQVVDIITFAEAPWGLKMKLFPVQRVILKCHYGIELDDNPHGFDLTAPIPINHPAYQPDLVDADGFYHLTVPIWDWRREKCTYFTEAGYLRHLYKEKRSNIEVVVPGEQRRIMVLSVGRRSGKCVEGDTLVLTDKGIYPIQDLGDVNGPEYQPLVIGVAQEKGNRSESAYFYNGGVQDTFHVHGYTGSLIKGTDKHRVKVLGEDGVVEWCRLDDLRPGMFLAVDFGADLWSNDYIVLPDGFRLDETTANLLGRVVATGFHTESESDTLQKVGYLDRSKTPKWIFRSPKSVVQNYLESLLDVREELVTPSLQLASETRILLLNMGIPSKIKRMPCGKYLLSMIDKGENPHYFFDEVVSIEKGQAPVYDLTVPNGQSFVANGLVNHNTAMAACISAYETYKLIKRSNPQAHYGMAPAANIQLISIATDKDQAGLLYQEVSGHFQGCTFFQPYMANNTQSYARFQTPKDIETGGSYQENPSAKATIKVTFRSCIAKGLRGAANIVVILDEVAHFTDDGQSSAQAVYDAIIPSTSTYYPKYPGTKKPIQPEKNDARIIMISSPLGCQGLFYKQFRIGMGDKGAEASREMLSIQAPTWEVRPDIPAAEFIGRYAVDPKTFAVEYGAEFSNRTSGWIEDKRDLEACIKVDARPRYRSVPKLPHYVGLDFAQAGDGTAISIGHIEDGQVVLDLEDQIQANVGEYEDQSRLEFSEIVDWVYDFSKKFYIVDGIFDQWTGIAFEQALQARGLRQFRRFIATPQLNSDMYKNFKDMMYERKLSLYDWPIPPDKDHGPLIEELLELQATQKSKYVISVEAPKGMGKHDDRSDALVRMVWLASQQVASTPKVLAGASMNNRILPSGMPLAQRAIAQSIYQTQIKARQTGSSPERQVPRNGNSGKSFLAGGGLGRLGLGGPGFNGRGRGGGRR